uniref:Leucine-rich repeat-containing N-terminal plant-type domain-containing protein n=1 Tax=Oryza nivara TaxID=4536 RepID=A0A0E0HSF1_ORYNI
MSNTCLLPVVIGGVLLLSAGECSSQLAAGDRDTLVAIRKGWGNPRRLASWDPDSASDHCSWDGVMCSDGGGGGRVVTELSLSDMKLTWTLPAAMCDFVNLTRLDLSNTGLPGTFPGATLYRCSQLRFLDLANNTLHGALPRDIGNLSPLRGEMSEDFGNLRNLTLLSLYMNNLTGTIPASIGLLPKLSTIWLDNNNLFGELPPELGKHSPLSSIGISNNNLSGPLPETLCANGELYGIYASNNNFSRNLPANLGDCVLLQELVLDNNRFSGDFPEKIWLLPELEIVMIPNNNFTGVLPAVLSSNIQHIEMGNNMFSGSIPRTAISLRGFWAENNQLDGELPADMSKLANLTDLSMPDNHITGPIPASIKLLLNLNSLNLSGNQLTGPIP